ncbi:MAG: FGGY family carbohydrate kinase [Anaerolineales bacterium]
MPLSLMMGIDLGTSGTKTVVLHPERGILGSAAREYALHTPRPGWAEQNPEAWYRAALETAGAALAQAGVAGEDIAAVAFSGQMHGMVCLDRYGQLLRPAIVWPDQRSQAQVERVKREVGEKHLAEWTANPLATGFMLPSWLWLRENEPEVAEATRQLLLPKDYVRDRFTGAIGTEPSDASSTGLFDPKKVGWSETLLSALHIPPGLLPPVHASAGIAGGLLDEAAKASGLRPGTPVVYGGGDQACQALGNGVIDPGVASSTIGTGGQVLAPLLSPAYDPELRLHLYCHALPERWFRMAAILSAGLSLRWLRDSLLVGLTDRRTGGPRGGFRGRDPPSLVAATASRHFQPPDLPHFQRGSRCARRRHPGGDRDWGLPGCPDGLQAGGAASQRGVHAGSRKCLSLSRGLCKLPEAISTT